MQCNFDCALAYSIALLISQLCTFCVNEDVRALPLPFIILLVQDRLSRVARILAHLKWCESDIILENRLRSAPKIKTGSTIAFISHRANHQIDTKWYDSLP